MKRAARKPPIRVCNRCWIPAILAAAKVALTGTAAATAPRTATTTAAAVARHRPRFVDCQSAPHQLPAVQTLDRRLRLLIVVYLNEPKTARLAAEAIAHHIDAIDTVSGTREEILDVGFV